MQLSVTDTGVGIAEEDQDRLFRAFEQVGEAKTRKFEGTGLGLYISQKLAEILGGEIMMESTPGRRKHVHPLPAGGLTWR